jgi:hypothetical protein
LSINKNTKLFFSVANGLAWKEIEYIYSKISPGACFIKLFASIVHCELVGNVRQGRKKLPGTNTLGYCTTEFITSINSFMIQAPGNDRKKFDGSFVSN